ncbi:MAG: motility associated factor glycosyltransferase family protein, partial [Planctomycetes bacterium]|nr:motility associated factor glycosyltransferase family protein [Planctomycetota bacterium]
MISPTGGPQLTESTAPTDGDGIYLRNVYLRNMEQLWRFDPQLAVLIDSVADAARPPLEETRSGDFTVSILGHEERRAYLHSRYDPRKEAAQLVSKVVKDDQYCFVVGGFGLGYHIAALREAITSDAIIVVTEPDITLIAAAFSANDMTDALRDGKLIVLHSADKVRLHERLRPHTALLMLGTRFVLHPPSQQVNSEFHKQLRGMITDFVAYSRMTLMTLISNSRITCKNISNNIGMFSSTPSIERLRDRYAGSPGIVISAGPSLRVNIDLLEEAKGRAVLCAVQTALRPMSRLGVLPDFVTSLDFHEISRQYFQGIDGLDDVHLVAEPKATWHVLDDFPGPVSLLDNEFARLLIGDELSSHAGLPAGATVAHLSFYLLRYMGCDPIIFVGQDLAYTGHNFYVPGVETHRVWQSELNRFNTMETKEWERIVRNRPVLRKVMGNDDREIYTDDLLFTYLEQFEKDIAETPATVINATEGGARIAGTTVMPLVDVLKTYAAGPLPVVESDGQGQLPLRKTGVLPSVC